MPAVVGSLPPTRGPHIPGPYNAKKQKAAYLKRDKRLLAGVEGFEPSARGFGDIYQSRILIALDKSSKYVMI